VAGAIVDLLAQVVNFTSGAYTFAGMGVSTFVGNVTLSNNVTVNFTTDSRTFATSGTVRTTTLGSAVPEPTSWFAAMGMGLCGTWYARRRLAKKTQVKDAVS